MKGRLNIVVLALEILTIAMLHAIKMNHAEASNKEMSSHQEGRSPDFSLQQVLNASALNTHYLK